MNSKNHQHIFEVYAVKWKLQKEQVQYIYSLIDQLGGKYGKSARVLKGFGFPISPRQLKYFYKKVRLHERLKIATKGKPANYRELLKRET